MSFSVTSISFGLVDNHILRARLRDNYGNAQTSDIDLDLYIGNEDGK